jgi:PAS domain S-box-containing protein
VKIAELPDDEATRLARLHALAVLDTAPEPVFDALARSAALACGAPIALVSLIDERRQWFKACIGLGVSETPRDLAFCSHAILSDALFEVPDATQDPRFADNPLVTGEPRIRFYAGVPLVMPEGERIGTLCVIDREPRRLDEGRRRLLKELAGAVVHALLLRERTLDAAWKSRSRLEGELDQRARALAGVLDVLPATVALWDEAQNNLYANAAHHAWFGEAPENLRGRAFDALLADAVQGGVASFVERVQAGTAQTFNARLPMPSGWRDAVFQVLPLLTPGSAAGARGPCPFVSLGYDVTAEQALLKVRERLAAIVQSSGDAIIGTDEGGMIEHWNAAAQRIFQYPAVAMVGRHLGLLFRADRELRARLASRQAFDDGPIAFDSVCKRRDASLLDVSIGAAPIRDEAGRVGGVSWVIRDISPMKAVENALRASQAMLDRAGHVARVGGWEVDLATQCVVWSAQTCRIHDREPGHQPSLTEALAQIPLQQRPLLDAAVRECIVTGVPFDLESPLVTATGRAIWVRIMGEAQREGNETVRLFGALQDVTAHRLAQDALRASQQQLRVLYEATPAMLQSMDAKGRLLTVTDVWLATLGYRREQVVDTPAQVYFAPASRQRLVSEVFPELWQRERIDGVALQMLASDGRVRDVLLSAVLDHTSQGAARRALVFIDDVTEDVARRAELQREQALRRQIEGHADELNQLLRERSEMLDVLAHEVRQPLNNASAALQGAAVALAGRGEDAATARLLRAQGVMGQVLAGVDNTLAAASLLAGNGNLVRTDTDVDTLIGVTIADIAQPERARIVVERATTTRTATMDMGLVRLALRNLLANALKYSPVGSPVRLRISDSDQPLALVLEVHDQGHGFDPALIPRLFERGARGAQGGHGLGLYIARRVMDLHGGHIELVSSTEAGTTLRLIIGEAGTVDA